MKKFKLNEIKNSSVYITPNIPNSETKRYKLGFGTILAYVGLYTLLVALLVSVLLAFTPLKHAVLFMENRELQVQAERLGDLQDKLVTLAHEMEEMASANKKLELALILAGADTTDSLSAVYDSLEEEVKVEIPIEGNIFAGLLNAAEFVWELFQEKEKPTAYFIEPAGGFIVKPFNKKEGHYGVDYALKKDMPVYSAAGGIVLFAGYTVDNGYTMMIQHDNGYISSYKHCSALLKKEREFAYQGETIALSGNSGENTTGPHLHFELWKDGKPINPQKVFINNNPENKYGKE